jgi:hypothetical protein
MNMMMDFNLRYCRSITMFPAAAAAMVLHGISWHLSAASSSTGSRLNLHAHLADFTESLMCGICGVYALDGLLDPALGAAVLG